MNKISIIFLIFIIYSIIGWVMEVLYTFIKEKRFIKRGFLLGPICPIYGIGAISLNFLLNKFLYSYLLTFFMCIVICFAIEYTVSYIMEKIFNCRWWDYSKEKYNIEGRVCLKNLLAFGIFGMISTYFLTPIFVELLINISESILNLISITLSIILFLDMNITLISIAKLKSSKTKKDSTERIHNMIYRQIKKARH